MADEGAGEVKLTQEERVEFMMYYAGIVAMARNHPGAGYGYNRVYNTGELVKAYIGLRSLRDCAKEAIDMIKARRELIG